MTELTELPFEYGRRWTELHKPMGVDVDHAAYMEERDRQLEDYLASLGSGGGVGDPEGFSFQASYSLAAATYSDPCSMNVPDGTSADQFHTDGITGVPGSGTFTQITVPAGVWAFGVHGDVDAASTPTSGRVLMGFNFGGGAYLGWETAVPWQAFTTDAFNRATIHGEKIVRNSSPFTASMYVSNFLDAAIATGSSGNVYWTGRQIGGISEGGVEAESDADGQRIPITDGASTIKGYLGYSAGGGIFGIWAGDADGAINYDTPLVGLDSGGTAYVQNNTGNAWITLSGGTDAVIIGGATVKILNTGAAGIDGTATPSTVAQLADVLVNLGIIASHTIP